MASRRSSRRVSTGCVALGSWSRTSPTFVISCPSTLVIQAYSRWTRPSGASESSKRVGPWRCAVHAHGLAALDELFREEAVALAGPKGHHQAQRSHHHLGTTATELTFGGRRLGGLLRYYYQAA